MKSAIRLKGGVMHDDGQWFAVVHLWDNPDCQGDGEQFIHPQGFDNEEDAMTHYRDIVKPLFADLMKNGDSVVRRKIDEIYWG